MQGKFGDGCADCEHADCRTAAAEIRIARKRADDDIEHQHRAEAVADDHNLVQRRIARPRQQRFGKKLEPRIDVRALAVNVGVGADPIIQQLHDAPAPAGPSQQEEKDGEADRHAKRRGGDAVEAEKADCQARDNPSGDGEQHD